MQGAENVWRYDVDKKVFWQKSIRTAARISEEKETFVC
jgi:hypothetical protein